MELLAIITFAILGALAVLPVQVIRTDRYYLRHDFWAHDYGLHLIAAALLQAAALFLGITFNCDTETVFIVTTFFNSALWAAKEINAMKQHVWSFGILPKSEPDWRDMRMSFYGLWAVNALCLLSYLIYQML